MHPTWLCEGEQNQTGICFSTFCTPPTTGERERERERERQRERESPKKMVIKRKQEANVDTSRM
jgi:hypothetical protein